VSSLKNGLSGAIREVPFVILTILLATLPWFWIPNGFVYFAEEANFINYDIKLETASTFWVKEGLGRDGDPANQSLLIPNAVLYRLGRSLGLDPSATQKAFLSFIFLSVAFSFGLFSTFFTQKSLVRCLGLLVYLFNFYLVTSIGYTAKTFLLVLMPMIFYLTVKYLQTRRLFFLLFNYLWLFSFQAIFTNVPTAIGALATYFFTLIYHLLLSQKKAVGTTLKYFCVLLLSIFPILLFQGIINLTVVERIREEPTGFTFTAIGAPLLDLFQFRGAWWEKSSHLGIDYFNLWPFYRHQVVVITTLLGIGAVLFSLFFVSNGQTRSDRIKLFFWLALYLLGLGLASGFYFVPGFYLWLVQNVPGMIMFRETWAKFIPFAIFSFSALTMIVVKRLGEQREKRFKLILALIFLMVGIQSYPFISGTIIDSRSFGWRRRLVKIPAYWGEFQQWSLKQDAVLLPIPFGANPFNSLYRWYDEGSGNSTDPIPCVLGMNVVCDSISHVDRFGAIIKKSVKDGSLDFLAWGGVDYVMKQRDLEVLSDQDRLIWQEKAVDAFIDPEPVSTFGEKLLVYKVKDQYLRPKIYVAKNIFAENQKQENIVLADVYYAMKTPSFLSDRLVTINQASSLSRVSYQKQSQVQYRVKVFATDEPYVLILSENFSRGWKIFRGEAPATGPSLVLAQLRRLFSRPAVSEEFHFVANGHANGWYIDQPVDGVFTIIYQPDDLYSLALLLSVGLFTASACLLIILKAVNR